jgi:NADH dehydrogenase (ubiquinone) Fe-S protein 2
MTIPIGKNGDCFDRYRIRMLEMESSTEIILQCLQLICEGPIKADNAKLVPPSRAALKTSMEAVIHHFQFFANPVGLRPAELYVSIEAPKGEFGVYLASNGTQQPYRCKIKAPGLLHLQGIDFMARGHLLPDVVTIIGTQDIVFGEVDR